MSPVTLYTVGHGNRALDALTALLQQAGIVTLVDVRAHPQSRRHPQFGSESLRNALEAAGLTYHWAGRHLGGMRPARPGSPHIALEEGLRGYADHMDTPAFQTAAAQLSRLAAQAPTAMLCAERLPEHCHRSLIADYLTLQGLRVRHLIDPDEICEHQLRPQARRESVPLIYDRGVNGRLNLT
jgi:uncharacterized protein (DUF488 family)